ncbi:hypothetical protein ACFFGH_32920 [Lysobacter korlensis]|uniref:Uncharacterized protein n=1 Tax=Lysobacter korlensis TaxID=553636 RepID=A0ABV6S3G4_9GAMM
MSEYSPVLLQYQALYMQYVIAKRAREAALPPEISTHNRRPQR